MQRTSARRAAWMASGSIGVAASDNSFSLGGINICAVKAGSSSARANTPPTAST